ncbi:MAG TPA: SpoIIE family protein phosphatase [Acidimicrobiia bacterium]|nr:SpoIIE family protein phosphatase [Acidimicrobiia bacterium]
MGEVASDGLASGLSLTVHEASVSDRKWQWPVRGPLGTAALFVLAASSYAVGSRLAISLLEASGLASVFFIPAGITVGLLLRVPRRTWWAVLLAAGLAEASMDLLAGYSAGATAGFVAANVVEPLLGALIVERFCGSVDLSRLLHLWWFFVGAVVLGPAVGAAVGSAPSYFLGEGDFIPQFGQWWLGDALGVVLVGGAILVWNSSPDRRSVASLWGAMLIVGCGLLTMGVIGWGLSLLFLVLIGVTLAGVAFGARAVAMTALAVSSTVAIAMAIGDVPSFPGQSPISALIILQLELWVFTTAGFVVAAEAHEFDAASQAAVEASARARIVAAERRLEHEIANRFQTAFLPDAPDEHPSLTIAARYLPGGAGMLVGGDWHDVITLADGRSGVLIGDVAGHGLDSAIAMGKLRTAAAAFALEGHRPAQLLSSLERYVQGRTATDFATLFYAIVDTAERVITYASAGHPPMLLVDPDGTIQWLDDGRSPAIVAGFNPRRSEVTIPVAAGSLLVGYTDGLVEKRDEDMQESMERLAGAVRNIHEHSPDAICDGLLEEMGAGADLGDDAVVVALRLGAAAR